MEKDNSRRAFLQKTALAGAGLLLADHMAFASNLLSKPNPTPPFRVRSKGYAARDSSGNLGVYEFERQPVGDNDILIEIKFSGVCHSDIHTVKGEWGDQKYPLVPGHEIAGIVTAVGKNVKKFKVGDHAGVGCMVDSCGSCKSCKDGLQQYCEKGTTMTYGTKSEKYPTGVTQGGYANNLVVTESFAIKIPKNMSLQDAAPLLCAGVTTYSPLMKADVGKGMKVGVAGIGGLGHLAIKIAVSKGAEVYAFTTTNDKVDDIKKFGAKEVIVVDDLSKLDAHKGTLDYMISTIPVSYDLSAYIALVKPNGNYTQVGLPAGNISFNNFAFISSRVNFNGSLIGGIPETQEILDYCAQNKIYPEIQIVDIKDINDVYDKVLQKKARYRYVIDAKTI
ncbi:Zn-dependent alcohol dehydrogenase [Chryseobacterium shigense]|uniref:Alcohol dehydrogenase (NADP+)/uncharacterized zinc-type alcohol dehydrogenase-like protein n=2 Tax=Chryseobacterium shigense TaxID=297244 RepID=A0A1N7I892_9FLAO|nr:Zn-dependent alcohol dehydrogenase [Chryseobacterium shigense]SIS33289.1 alcohol dehydrogenase (NADP+)/uncharacterized zinc-type alcohol dehydrogenase-like protein [Chryseobacterium shigense]